MCKIIYHYLLYYLYLTNFVSNTNELSTMRFLTSDRSTDRINILFSHFIPFNDMLHTESRKQRNGIIENFLMKNLNNLPIGREIYVNFTNILHHYYELSKLIVNKSSRSSQRDLEEKTFLALLRLIINGTSIKGTDYLHYIHTINYTNINYVNFIKKAYEKSVMPYKYVPGQPWHILLMHAWRLYYLLIISSSNIWFRYRPGRIVYEGDLPKTLDAWSVTFIYLLCLTFQSNKNVDMHYHLPHGFCPNPCLTNPCHKIKNTVSNRCIKTGYFENDFQCECHGDYQWKRVKGHKGYCEAIDLCSKYCDKVGTRKCDIIQGRYFCICRPTHMGLNCSYTRDPCVELASNVHMSGNSACNVANGGVCWGTLGTNTYHCQCPASFTSDPFYSFSNCLQVRDQCASTICIHGDCVSSKDGQEAHCICHEEAYGKYCEFTRGQWAQWSPWSECSPNCGLHNHQKRIRTRDCLGEACSGGLGYLHMEFCDIQPCSNEILMLNRLNSSEDIEKLKLQVLQIESTRYIEMSSRLAKYLLLITCVLSAAVATAITLVVYCA